MMGEILIFNLQSTCPAIYPKTKQLMLKHPNIKRFSLFPKRNETQNSLKKKPSLRKKFHQFWAKRPSTIVLQRHLQRRKWRPLLHFAFFWGRQLREGVLRNKRTTESKVFEWKNKLLQQKLPSNQGFLFFLKISFNCVKNDYRYKFSGGCILNYFFYEILDVGNLSLLFFNGFLNLTVSVIVLLILTPIFAFWVNQRNFFKRFSSFEKKLKILHTENLPWKIIVPQLIIFLLFVISLF